MKLRTLSTPLAVAIGLFCVSSASAQALKTWKGANGDFYDPNNWDLGLPGATDIALINNGNAATIGANAGERELGTIKLGDASGGTESGHVIMNGGVLKIGGTEGDPKAVIGFSTVLSTFIMNGGTIFFDGPDSHPGSTTDDGLNGLDWEVGEGGLGRFEMHNDAVFRGGDDLKIAENAAGNGSCLIDGNARLSVGSGISISSGGEAEQIMVIAGNALVESGNSMGAGNPQGSTDEGYLTLAIGGGRANLTVQDDAVLNFRVLSAREGTTRFTVRNNGQVHIFDVLTGKGFIDNQTAPDRPAVVGGFRSSLSSGGPSDSTLILQDNAQMTVNAEAGLGISGPRDASNPGGKALFTISDSASFRVEQQLALGTGTSAETSDGTLEVIGPSAKITIGGNFNMAVDPDGNVVGLDANGESVPGKSTLKAVIRGASHSTVNVGGIARIGKGVLKVKLDGYTPIGGESYTLIKGGTIEGEFLNTDFSEATLAAGLSWKVDYAADSVRLSVSAPPFVIGGVGSVGLTSVVPDSTLFDTGSPNLDNWEPSASVLGNSVFLIEANTFALNADGSVDPVNQRYGVAFQPVAGGAPKLGNGFFADNGQPFAGQINLSRQNGNPGRVAGDKRPGAVNFVTGGEASLYGYPNAFNSDGRFNANAAFYTALAAVSTGSRDATVQAFSLDTTALTQSMLSKAFDSAFGRCCAGQTPPDPVSDQISRFGGELAGLDNGNFVSVVEDRSKLFNPAANAAVATIFRPDGSIVKEAFKVADGDLWSNVAAYKGGFAVRVAGVIYFYDNEGNLKGQADQDTAEGSAFDRGRGDGTRLVGHINSPYVFLAGRATDLVVRLAAFDSRDQKFAGLAVVNEGGLVATFDRVNVAVDALNRVAVAYEVKPENYEQFQIALRVFNFDGTAKTFAPLTKSFYPFVNNAATGIRTLRPSVAITTKQILVAGKGEINSANNPSAGPNTPAQTTIYTVVTHPDPKDDPTPPAGAPPATVPGKPEDNGLAGKTATFYINTPDIINNGNTESLGVAIANNGNVIIGWEDDGEALEDLEAVWTLFDNTGKPLTPDTQITTIDPNFAGQTLTSKFLAFFRADKSAVAGRTSWGPKIHANLFGDGFGMGATSFELGIEVVELAAINLDAGGGGDFPSVQLLANDGQPQGIVTGLNDADAEPSGDVRIADWEFLGNGNIVVVGESRQVDDLVSKYGGAAPANHAVYRVVGANGSEIKATALVSETAVGNEIWHGAGATKDGFAIRFAQGGRAIVRLFNNSGAPVGGNIDLGTVANDEAAAGGGRGDGTGFHGNGNDAYVAVNGSGTQVRLTVLKADGTLRYSRSVTDLPLKSVGRADAAITPSGEVLVVFSATYDGGPVTDEGTDVSVVMGRLFDASGNPSGGTFYVSEKEVPTAKPLLARNPRVAWRGNTAAVVWESQNSGQTLEGEPVEVVAARLFTIGAASEPLRISSITPVGAAVTITWTGGEGPFLVQGAIDVTGPWIDLVTTTERSTTQPYLTPTGFFRIGDKTTKTVRQFRAVLTGAAERPNPVVTTATGIANVSLDGSTGSYVVVYGGLSGPATAGHFHGPATANEAAGVLLPFAPLSPLAAAGVFGAVNVAIPDALKTAIETGRAYANIHTAANGGGEIRGQLVPAAFKVTLSGAAERPNPVTTTATGSGTLTLFGNQLIYNVNYSGLSSAATAAHIHGPATAEQAAGVLQGLTGASGTSGTLSGTLTLTDAQLESLLGGLTYVNIHTANNGGGEIRGQILP